MAHKKVNLPQKTCPVCQRPFTWRKKWEKDWEQVIYLTPAVNLVYINLGDFDYAA